jgi:hypothetical protein
MPVIFEKIAKGNGKNIQVNSLTKGKYTFHLHSKREEIFETLENEKFDVIVLQGSSRDLLKDSLHFRTKTYPALDVLIRNFRETQPKAKIVFFMTWPYKNGYNKIEAFNTRLTMFRSIELGYENLSKKYNVDVVPVGKVWFDYFQKFPNSPLYCKDNAHPLFTGSFLTASTFYAYFYRSKIYETKYSNRGLPIIHANRIKKFISNYSFR